jgi:signal transduction histidine kinase
MSLKFKISLSISILIIFLTLILLFSLRKNLQKFSEEHISKIGNIILTDFSLFSSSYLSDYNYYWLKTNIKKFTGVNELVYATVFDDNGRLIAYYPEYESSIYDYIEKSINVDEIEKNTSKTIILQNSPVIVFQKSIRSDEKRLVGFVQIALSKEKTLQGIKSITKKVFLLTLTTLFIFMITLSTIVYRFTEPLKILIAKCFETESQLNLSRSEKKLVNSIPETKNMFEAINKMLQTINFQNKKIRESEKNDIYVNLSKQLSHDIRSPLAALKVVRDLGAERMDKDQAKLLTMSIDRITDIANTILPKNTNQVENKDNVQSSFLWMLIDQIISEKRVEYKSSNDISIEFQTESSPFELNVFCNPTEFMRSISNIINNSIEAKDPERKLIVTVQLKSTDDHIALTITDNGRGISPEILPKIFDDGFSYEKSQGTGLGLFQVKNAVESWGGNIQVESELGKKTTITIKLRKSTHPDWLATSIRISSYKNMVILDDEEYVFNILQDRFERHFKEIQYFKRIDEFEESIMSFTNSFIFVDHDLKQHINGIDLIQKYNLQQQTILLTGNYDDKQVQQRAIELGIKILPKPLINDLPIIT